MKMKYIIDNENKAMESISADIYDKMVKEKRFQAQQDKERYAKQQAHKRWQSQQDKDKALTHYIDSISKTDIQDLMEYVDSLKQSENAEESQISKGRTR